MTESTAKQLYRQRMAQVRADKFLKRSQPQVWNNRERRKTARLVVMVVLAYSPKSLGAALQIAGMLIQCIDKTWEKADA